MKYVYIIATSLFIFTLSSCNNATSNKAGEAKEPIESTSENPQILEESPNRDFLKNYEDFVNLEVSRLEKSPTAESIAESKKAAEAFINQFGDPNAIEMTPEAQQIFNTLRDKYNEALKKALPK